MRFELTISGLCIIALKSQQPNPVMPDQVDIIVPDAHHHTSRLSYKPAQFSPRKNPEFTPDMFVDPTGVNVASFNMQGQALTFAFGTNPMDKHRVHWAPDPAAQKPASPWLETCANWLPKIEDLGFGKFEIGDPGTLPKGARARITLPPGALCTRKVVAQQDTNEYILWNFPATGVNRVLTNDVTYIADHVEDLTITDAAGSPILSASLGDTETLQMCISNDVTVVPVNY